MDIPAWRKKIDELDRQIVKLLNERASAAQEIGRLKRNSSLPIYEPDREQVIFDNVSKASQGPLPPKEVHHIFERIIDVMRELQKEEIVPPGKGNAIPGNTEFDVEVNE